MAVAVSGGEMGALFVPARRVAKGQIQSAGCSRDLRRW